MCYCHFVVVWVTGVVVVVVVVVVLMSFVTTN